MPCRHLLNTQKVGTAKHTADVHLRFAVEVIRWLNVHSASFQASTGHGDELAFFRDAVLNRLFNDFDQVMDGSVWPPGAAAMSMAGVRRADNFAAAIARAVGDGVPGNVIETGVWRGGLSFLAAKTLEVLGGREQPVPLRRMYICDSFQGIPAVPKHTGRHYSEQDKIAHKLGTGNLRTTSDGVSTVTSVSDVLNNNSLVRVQRDARRFRLRSAGLRWVPGIFNESLKQLVAEEPEVRFSVVRLDGDTYFSTWDAIDVLYPRLSPGGYLIIDDFTAWSGCRDAIMDYRRKHAIKEPLTLIPHRYGEEHIGAYWRRGFAGSTLAEQRKATCMMPSADQLAFTPSDAYLPSELALLTKADIDPSSPARSAVMYPHSGVPLLSLETLGDPVHRCVDRGVQPHDFSVY